MTAPSKRRSPQPNSIGVKCQISHHIDLPRGPMLFLIHSYPRWSPPEPQAISCSTCWGGSGVMAKSRNENYAKFPVSAYKPTDCCIPATLYCSIIISRTSAVFCIYCTSYLIQSTINSTSCLIPYGAHFYFIDLQLTLAQYSCFSVQVLSYQYFVPKLHKSDSAKSFYGSPYLLYLCRRQD